MVYRPSISTGGGKPEAALEGLRRAWPLTFDDVVYGGRAAEDADAEEAPVRAGEEVVKRSAGRSTCARVRWSWIAALAGFVIAARGARAALAAWPEEQRFVVVRDFRGLADLRGGGSGGLPAGRPSIPAAADHMRSTTTRPPTDATLTLCLDQEDVIEPDEAQAIKATRCAPVGAARSGWRGRSPAG